MRIHDVTATLRSDLPHWPGDTGLGRRLTSDQAAGDEFTASHLEMSVHTGTHIDAPRHFIRDGAGVDRLDISILTGPAVVVDLTHVEGAIRAEDLAASGASGATRLLARTRNSGWSRRDTNFRRDYIAFDDSAARWCIDNSVRLVGIDYLSIEPFDGDSHGSPVHHSFLGAGVIVLEGLELDEVHPGHYFLVSLPLPLPDSDGAPARTILIEGFESA
jgi:arylformamidase